MNATLQIAPNNNVGSQQAVDFIKVMFSLTTEAPVYICSLDNERNATPVESILTRDTLDIANFIETKERPGRGLFYCVGTIAAGSKSQSKANVVETIGLHTDIDLKDVTDSAADVERKLGALAQPPSIIVSSGHGFHCYWLLTEAIKGEGERVEGALKLLADLLGGDMCPTHIAALMRLPGTHNTKFGEWAPVRIVSQNDYRYELDDLEDWLAQTSPVILRKARPAEITADINPFLSHAQANGFKPSIDVAKRLAAMCYMGGSDAAIHPTQLSVSASMLATGRSIDEVVDVVLAATKCAATGYGERWNWKREEKAIRKMCVDWLKKYPLAKETPITDAQLPKPAAIVATPYVWKPASDIPRREWLYGDHLIRQFASATIAPGGVGKSSLVLTEAIAMATGKDLLGVMPRQRCRVWYWNGEDPADEIDRRIAAICIKYSVKSGDLEGWLFTDSGRDQEIIIATQARDGATIAEPVAAALIDTIRNNKIDVLYVDPFISSHRVTENDNNAIDLVAKQWAKIANTTNCAIDLVHHTRKTNTAEATVEDGRGASALLAAVRSARILNGMTEADANKGGVVGHRGYFKVENGKANLAPPPDAANWFQIQSISLGNGAPSNVLDTGDSVGVVTAWKWPDPLAGMTGADFEKAATAIRGGKWREHPQSADWVGRAVAAALGLDVELKADKARVTGMVKAWLRAGTIKIVDGLTDKREQKKFVEVSEDP